MLGQDVGDLQSLIVATAFNTTSNSMKRDHLVELIYKYLVSGMPDDLSDEAIRDFFTDADVQATGKEVARKLSIDQFKADQSLSRYVNIYKREDFARHYLGEHTFNSFMRNVDARHDFMYPQCFNIKALLTGAFEIVDTSEKPVAKANRSMLTLYSGTPWILVPFTDATTNEFYILICNEYWGFPCAVIDLLNHKYYTDHSSPLIRHGKEDICNAFCSIVTNICANIIAGYFSRQERIAQPVFAMGGVVNISHILWNYIGGFAALERCVGLPRELRIIAISELLFNTESIRPIDIHVHSRGLTALSMLNKHDCLSALHIRTSDAGINVELCNRLINSTYVEDDAIPLLLPAPNYAPSIICSPETECFQDPSPHQSYSSFCDDIVIALTLRSGARQLANQVDTYLQALRHVQDTLKSKVHVLIDGDAKSKQPVSHALSTSAALLQESLEYSQMESTNLIGLDIDQQIRSLKSCSTFVTYVSGGNAKFLGFCSAVGVLIGPESQPVLAGKRDLHSVCKKQPDYVSSAYLQAFTQGDSFGVYHDTEGYERLIKPPLLLLNQQTSRQIEESAPINTFNQVFSIDSLTIADAIMKTLRANWLIYTGHSAGF